MNKEQRKVVPMPGLYRRLVNQGIQSMDNDHFIEAEEYFYGALKLDSEEPQAHFGLVLSQVELGKAAEAKEHCEKMLAEGIGEYYDILDPYLTILIQLEEYEQITNLIEAVLQEHSVPANLAERLYQVLDFCRYKVSETQNIPDDKSIFTGEPRDDQAVGLSGNRAISDKLDQRLSPAVDEDMEKCQQFLTGKDNDPYFKSMMLQLLKDKNIEETVSVYKYGQTFDVNLKTMKDITSDSLFVAVKEQLNETLEQKNPSLHEMALQLWKHFMLSVFPLPVTPNDASVWAGAVHELVHNMNGMEISNEQTAALYRISEADLKKAENRITTVEKGTID